MDAEQESENVGRSVLLYTSAFPAVFAAIWVANPQSEHFSRTFHCSAIGLCLWVLLLCTHCSRRFGSWAIIHCLNEVICGLVPMIYLFVDRHRYLAQFSSLLELEASRQELMIEAIWHARIFAAVPCVLMTKGVIRALVGLTRKKRPVLKLAFVGDAVEVIVWILCGYRSAQDLGEVWFDLYCGMPVVVSSLVLDKLVARVITLNTANDRLMQSAFAAVVRVDGIPSRVLDSNMQFDCLVDGPARHRTLESMFTARREDLEKLVSPSADADRVVRRLRTSLVSISKAYQQDVELRVLSATEHELRDSGTMLGVSITGEREPFASYAQGGVSMLIEQHVDEIGHLMVSKHEVGETQVNSAMDPNEVGAYDSVSVASRNGRYGGRSRRPGSSRGGKTSEYSKATSASDASDQDSASIFLSPASAIPDGSTARAATCEDAPGGVRSVAEESHGETGLCAQATAPAYGQPWQAVDGNCYLEECSLSTLNDLIASWNYGKIGCCNWHDAVARLQRLVAQMSKWKQCNEPWPDRTPSWQCSDCGALDFEDDDACILCFRQR